MEAEVHQLAQQAVRYLQDVGLPATALSRRQGKALPYYLADAFELVELELADQPVLLAIDPEAGRAPAEIEQRMRKLDEVLGSTAVYVTDALSSYDRKRLVERRVPFLVPGNQLYLPGLGMDLREHFRKPVERRPLSPSAQAVLIVMLRYPARTMQLTAADIAATLGYSPMTASRAARELAAAGLAELHRTPAGQVISLTKPPKGAWALALPLLRSPVHRTVFARQRDCSLPPGIRGGLVLAGVPALARQTMLAKDGPEVFACSQDTWKNLKERVQVLPRADDHAHEVQIWSYPPTLNTDAFGAPPAAEADPLSLYLSLRDADDPRVQAALDELMDQVWR